MFKDSLGRKTSIARIIGGIIFLFWVFGSLAMSVFLFLQSRYYPATGWAIISVVFIFFTCLFFLTPRGGKLCHIGTSKYFGAKINKPDENLVLLVSTKDQIRLGQIQQALQNKGISSVILDQHSTVMIGFLPDVEMRIMVHAKDFENSARIIDNLQKREQNVRQKVE